MTPDDRLVSRLTEILVELAGMPADLAGCTDLAARLDSLALENVVMAIEVATGRPMPSAMLVDANFNSLAALVATARRIREGH